MVFIPLCLSFVVYGQKADTLLVATYNVENLFDPADDPQTADDDFTPTGSMKWDRARYRHKLNRVARVINELGGMQDIDVMALSEVENDSVLYHLCHTTDLATKKYSYLITHGSDPRGINVALLYQPQRLRLQHYEEWQVPFARDSTFRTRNLLYARGAFLNTIPLHLFACHLPSNKGGVKATEPYRQAVIKLIQAKTDSLLRQDPTAAIIVLGDFNTPPQSKSTIGWADSLPSEHHLASSTKMYDVTSFLPPNVPAGSYIYRGIWSQIDRIIVSSSLISGSGGVQYVPHSAHSVPLPFLSTTNKDGEKIPNRCYKGVFYNGGVSDHFPVVAKFTCPPLNNYFSSHSRE